VPEARPKEGKYRLYEFAGQDYVLRVYCAGCRKTVRYLVDDLIKLKGRDWDVICPPYPCSRCKTREWMGVWPEQVTKADVGMMDIRRPSKVITIQKWKTVKLGDPVD